MPLRCMALRGIEGHTIDRSPFPTVPHAPNGYKGCVADDDP